MCFGGGETAGDIFAKKMAERPKFELPSLASGSADKAVRKGAKMEDVKVRKGAAARSLLNPLGKTNG